MAEGKYARIAHLAQQYQESGVEVAERLTTRGKSSNSAYRRRTVILKDETIKTSERLWEDLEPRQDFSDLVEKLLVEWVQTQTA
jgi:hypothetical protein